MDRQTLVAHSSTGTWRFDDHLRVKAHCELPTGWSWGRLRNGDTWGSVDPRTCRVTTFSKAFTKVMAALEKTDGEFSGDIVFSPSRKLVVIDPEQSMTATVFAYPSMEEVKTEECPTVSAKFGPGPVTAVSDAGLLTWGSRGDPCFGLAEASSWGDPAAFIQLDGRVYASAYALAVVKEEFGGAACALDASATERELAHFDLGVPLDQLTKRFAGPGFMLVSVQNRAWLVTFPRRKQGFDYASPRTVELLP